MEAAIEYRDRQVEAPQFYTCTAKQLWSFATYVYFGVRQAVADTPFFTTIILKNYKFGTILVQFN
jgi:hypothetical protein